MVKRFRLSLKVVVKDSQTLFKGSVVMVVIEENFHREDRLTAAPW